MFFIEVHLLAGKLVLVVEIHSFGGSRANWHHTLLTQNVTHYASHTASRKAWLQLSARVLRDPETCQSV